MRKLRVVLSSITLVFALLTPTSATLIDRGDGLIYDTDLNITWLQDANLSGTAMTWDDAVAWADQLVYGGYGDWRLPSPGINPQEGYYQTGSELGHLFYVELGIAAGTNSTTPVNTGPFNNLTHGFWWMGHGIEPYPGGAWYFVFNSGFQHGTGKDSLNRAWAVRYGDVAPASPPPSPNPVPEPATMLLFASGLVAWAGLRKKFRRLQNAPLV